jgi:hypothetical protein
MDREMPKLMDNMLNNLLFPNNNEKQTCPSLLPESSLLMAKTNPVNKKITNNIVHTVCPDLNTYSLDKKIIIKINETNKTTERKNSLLVIK